MNSNGESLLYLKIGCFLIINFPIQKAIIAIQKRFEWLFLLT